MLSPAVAKNKLNITNLFTKNKQNALPLQKSEYQAGMIGQLGLLFYIKKINSIDIHKYHRNLLNNCITIDRWGH